MFGGLFNYDNPIWRGIGKLWDVLIVNLIWFVCSIPVFTIGASTTALYYVTLKLVRDEDGYTFRSFFHSFKENFKQATIIWFLMILFGGVLFIDVWFVLMSGRISRGPVQMLFSSVFLGLLIIWFLVFTYVFAVLARFYGSVKRILFNALFMSMRHILYTVGIIAIDVLIVFLTFSFLPFLMAFGMGLIAYVNSFFMNRIFKKYSPAEERDIHEMRPVFADEEEAQNPAEEISAAEGNTAEGNTAEGNTTEGNTAEGNTAEGSPAADDLAVKAEEEPPAEKDSKE